jgi:lysozyme family protein
MEQNREACFSIVLDEQAKDPKPEPDAVVSHWSCCRCAALPAGLDLFVLDTSLVCGTEPTLRWLELACGAGVDPAKVPSRPVILDLESYRKRALRSKPGWVEFHTKWVNRTLRVKKKAVKMVNAVLEGRT